MTIPDTLVHMLLGALGILPFATLVFFRILSRLKPSHTDSEKFKLAVEHASDHIVITDAAGTVLYANAAAETMTGYSKEEMLGTKVGRLWGGYMDKHFYTKMWHTISVLKKPYIGELNNRRKNGRAYIAEIHVSPILDKRSEVEFFVALERDITKQKEIDRMKTEFISLASHELKTPLSAIQLYTEHLLKRRHKHLAKEDVTMIQHIYASNKRLIEITNTLLDISRMESGKMLTHAEPTDLRIIAQEVIDELRDMIALHHHRVAFAAGPNLPLVKVDPQLMRNVFMNLLSNAIKYTPPNGNIVVGIARKNGQLVSFVRDSGCGIPAHQHDRVFEKFFRADNIGPLGTKGTGLGLYLVKAVVHSSGGKVWFESKENKGTTFWFSLPALTTALRSHPRRHLAS